MATREQVLQSFETTRSRMREQARHFRNWNKSMQYHFPDLEEDWFITIDGGEPAEPQQGVETTHEEVLEAGKMTVPRFVALIRGILRRLS